MALSSSRPPPMKNKEIVYNSRLYRRHSNSCPIKHLELASGVTARMDVRMEEVLRHETHCEPHF